MKKRILASCLSMLLLVLLLTGCGSSASLKDASRASGSGSAMTAQRSTNEAYDYDAVPQEAAGSGMTTGGASPARADAHDKIIYSGSANVETIRFDETVEQVYALVERYGGFLENAYVTGKDYYTTYYGKAGYRSAEFTIRVPREAFQSLNGDLETLGQVTYSSVQAENITAAYTDTQSRLDAYRTEEERLLAMLEKAETVEDMLNIESRLSDVRYHLESLTTTLNNWDSKVNYSTLRLSLSEVKELKEETPITRTFGDDIAAGFRDSCRWLVRALKDITIFILSALPVLVIPVALAVAVLLILRGRKHKKGKKQSQKDVKDDN